MADVPAVLFLPKLRLQVFLKCGCGFSEDGLELASWNVIAAALCKVDDINIHYLEVLR
jgi:hypothetical protein